MKRCRHAVVARAAQVEFAPGVQQTNGSNCRNPLVDAKRCLDCGAWLPLGEANDADPNVAIEIRAAEIAADWGRVPPRCNDDVLENDCAVCGWYEHLEAIDQATPEWHAGYLAREIATNDAARGGVSDE